MENNQKQQEWCGIPIVDLPGMTVRIGDPDHSKYRQKVEIVSVRESKCRGGLYASVSIDGQESGIPMWMLEPVPEIEEKEEKIVTTAEYPAIAYFDGGSRGNPGLAAGGFFLKAGEKEISDASVLNRPATNNEAEYTGLIMLLERAIALGIEHIKIRGDSQLVVSQVLGDYECKKAHLREFATYARQLLAKIPSASLSWIPREQNAMADWICNCAMSDARGKPRPPKPGDKRKAKNPIASAVLNGGSFGDFLKLKSGRDNYSSKKLPVLAELVGDRPLAAIREQLPGNADPDICKVLRWYLRGRDACPDATEEELTEFCIRKFEVDAEVSENAAQSKSSFRY